MSSVDTAIDIVNPDARPSESNNDVEAEVAAELVRTIPEAFGINSPEAASWLVRRVLAARDYVARVQAWAAMEERRGRAEEEYLLLRYQGQLRLWVETEIATLRGRKSINLPGGRVGFRTVPARIVVDNEEEVLTWAKHHCPKAVVFTERLVKTPLNEHFASTGELPNSGAHLEPESQKLYIR